MSNSLQPHELQHARPPCPLPIPGVYSNSCPLSQWCLPAIRVFSNESTLHMSWPKYGSFSFSISPSNEYSRLISFRIDWFDLLADSQESSPTPQFKSINSLALINSSLWSKSHVHTWLLECHGYMTTMVFIVFEIFQTVNYYLLQWTIISDLWCHYCKKITTWWRSWWRSAFFSSTLFLIRHVHCVFRRNAIIAHSTDYSIV